MKKSRQGFLSLQIMLLLVTLAVVASAVYLTFSYFTASNTRTGNLTMATVQLNMLSYNSGTSEYELSSNLNVTETELTDTLLPGSTVNITGTRIKNNGNKPVYALMNLNVSVKADNVDPIYYEKWYDCEGHEVDIENFAISTYGASLIDSNNYVNFSTNFTFPEADITNDYQGATAKFRLTAYGIQTTLPNTECYVSVPHYAGYMIATNLYDIQQDNLGKNLLGFDGRTEVVNSSSGEWATSNATLRTGLGNNHILKGFTCNNNFQKDNVESYSISGNSVTMVSTAGGYGLGFDFTCNGNEKYTISKVDTNTISIAFYDSTGAYLSDDTPGNVSSHTFETPTNSAYFVIVLRPNTWNTSVTYTNLQLEKGSSATSFEPYVQYELIPNDYKVVNYIESDGSQRIYTNVSGEIEIDGTFQFTSTSATSYWGILKASGVSSNRTYGIEVNYPTNTFVRVIESAYNRENLPFDTDIHNYKRSFTVSTNQDTAIGEWQLLTGFCKGRLYNFKIYQAGDLVRYYIPCVRNSDGVAGLYDVVTNEFYTNSGTGSFTTGEKTFVEPLMKIISSKNLLGFEDRTEVVSSNSGEWAISNSTLRTGLSDNHILKGFTYNNYFSSTNLTNYSISGNSISITSHQSGYGIGLDFKCNPNEQYTVSKEDSNPFSIAFYDASGNSLSADHPGAATSRTFTTPTNSAFFVIVLRPSTLDTSVTYTNLQLERGTSATTFEPYVLVQDSYNSITSTLTRNVLKIVFDGTENDANTVGTWEIWNQSITDTSAGADFYALNILGRYGSPLIDEDYSYSSHYKKGNHPISTTTKVGDYVVTDSTAPPYIAIRVPYTTLEEWRAFLASEYAEGNPVTFWLKLATPVVTVY